MSGSGTRTRSGEKARAKAAGRSAKAGAEATTPPAKAAKSKTKATRAPVRSGAATAAPRRRRRATAPEAAAPPRRRRRVVLVIVVVALAIGGLAVLATRSPLLDVESVQVRGVVAERAAAVRDVAGVAVGDPVVAVLPGRVAGRIEDLAWVEEAHVTRTLSGTVAIDVVPRTPVGWVAAGERTLVVDADATVIEKVAAPPAGVPELVGVADLAPVGGRIAPAGLPAAAGALGTELRMRIASVALDDGAVRAQVVYGPELRFGTPERMVVKARVAAAVLASLGATTPAYVDVSVPAAPVSG